LKEVKNILAFMLLLFSMTIVVVGPIYMGIVFIRWAIK